MATIPSTMSATGLAGLAFNEAIQANNDKVIADIELNQTANQASNSMNLTNAQATEASLKYQSQQTFDQACGGLASAIGGGVAGFGMIGLENSFAKSAQAAGKTDDMSIEMKEIPSIKAPSALSETDAPAAAGTVEGSNPAGTNSAQKGSSTQTDDTEPKMTREQARYTKLAKNANTIGSFLPNTVAGIGKSGGDFAASQAQAKQAEAQAMATAAQGLTSLLSKNAEAASAAQQSAQSNIDALIKTVEAMVMANRTA